MIITSDFNKLCFHDASIDKVSRDEHCTTIKIFGVFISKEHPQAQGKDWAEKSCILKFHGVENEEAKYWDDTKTAKPHPEPEMPLDEIMNASLKDGVFHFDGFKESVPWFEWIVTAQGFSLEVVSTK